MMQLSYIGNLVTEIRGRYPSGCISKNARVVPEILERIYADPAAVPIFLMRHIESAARLTTGFTIPLLIVRYLSFDRIQNSSSRKSRSCATTSKHVSFIASKKSSTSFSAFV
jgi:hypothetical protein